MKQSITSSQNQLGYQPQRIKPEELEHIALHARKRAIEARQVANISSVQTSYNFGGWKSLFEEYVQQPSSSNAILHEYSISHHKSTEPAPSLKAPTSADCSNRLSQSSNNSSSSESTLSVAAPAEMPLCPSGRAEAADAVVFGVVGGTVAAPKVGYLTEPMLINEDMLALSSSVEPTEIFRIASTCAGNGCQHFDGSQCRLAMRIVEQLPPVVETLPACQIRPQCRWWQQEGKVACLRCPQVLTDNYYASDLFEEVAKPK